MSAFNASKVYWRARCGLVWVEGVEVWRELAEVEIDWGKSYVAVLKDYVFSSVIFGSLSKNTKTRGLRKKHWRSLNDLTDLQRKALNPQFRLFDWGFNFYSWQLGASEPSLFDRMNIPEFVQKSCAINCHRLRILHGCMLDTMLRRRNGVRQKHSDIFLGLAVGYIILLEYIRVSLEAMIAIIWAKRDNHLQLLGYRKPMLIVIV